MFPKAARGLDATPRYSRGLAKSLFFVDNGRMGDSKKVVGLGVENELVGPSLREKGFSYADVENISEAMQLGADFILWDYRKDSLMNPPGKLSSVPILSIIDKNIRRDVLKSLKEKGSQGYLPQELPAEEVVLQVQALSQQNVGPEAAESRSSRRVWFQQKVEFRVFNEVYEAWSTTLSETGIFLRTPLSFPLYSVIRLKFYLFGETEAFECDGVVVRQESEADVKGMGIMFQNLKGENVRRLQSFFEIYS
jgi:hypothetical protein